MQTTTTPRRRPLPATLGASLLLALCTACGGGGGSNSQVAVTPPPAGNGGGTGTVTPPPVITPPLSILAGKANEAGDFDRTGTDARFYGPGPLAIDAAGNLYTGQPCAIRKITPAGVVSTLPVMTFASVCSIGLNPNRPDWIAIVAAADGTLTYTGWSGVITEVSPAGVARTVAELEDGYVEATGGKRPWPGVGIAVDAAGNLIVANDLGIRRISPAGVTTMLDGVANAPGGINTYIARQRGVAVGADGSVYLAALDNTIVRIDAAGRKTVLAGTPFASGSSDGTGAAARFTHVAALVLDGQGNLYAADSSFSLAPDKPPFNELIRKITPAGVVTTIAGKPGVSELQTGALPGSLAPVRGIALDGKGKLYATSGNAVVQIILP